MGEKPTGDQDQARVGKAPPEKPPGDTVFCATCGSAIPAGATKCPQCGVPQKAAVGSTCGTCGEGKITADGSCSACGLKS